MARTGTISIPNGKYERGKLSAEEAMEISNTHATGGAVIKMVTITYYLAERGSERWRKLMLRREKLAATPPKRGHIRSHKEQSNHDKRRWVDIERLHATEREDARWEVAKVIWAERRAELPRKHGLRMVVHGGYRSRYNMKTRWDRNNALEYA